LNGVKLSATLPYGAVLCAKSVLRPEQIDIFIIEQKATYIIHNQNAFQWW